MYATLEAPYGLGQSSFEQQNLGKLGCREVETPLHRTHLHLGVHGAASPRLNHLLYMYTKQTCDTAILEHGACKARQK